jgi:hypothetical protein
MTRTGFKMAALLVAAGWVGSASAAPIVIDLDGDGDDLLGPDVVGNISTPNNGGFGANNDAFNDSMSFNGDGAAFNGGTPNPNGTATFTFTAALGLVAGETYNVYGYWRGQANTPNAGFVIGDGGPSVVVDQTVRSSADLLITDPDPAGNNAGLGTDFPFQLLGTVTEDGDGVLTVTINDGGDGGFFLADAVAINLVPEPGSLALGGLALLRRRRA